jgi:peptide/nickel transport system substrate-binding protein
MPRSARAVPLAVTLAAALAVAGCSSSGGAKSGPTTLNIGTMSKLASMDPQTAGGSVLPYFQAVYDTLIKRAADGSYGPMLATAWTYNSDNTQLSLTLRSGVKFEDGTPFDAAAVKANLERFAKAGLQDSRNLASMKSVAVVDETHVLLTLSTPDPGMLFYLSDSAGLMASPAAFANAEKLKTTPDGTGPYRLDAGHTVVGTKWVYTRNADYWGAKLPYDTLTISAFDNETPIVNGIKTGQLDTAVLQDAGQQASVKSAPGVTVADFEFDFQGILLFDRGGVVTPALKDPLVRQALNYALDRQTLLTGLRQGRGELTDQAFGTGTAGYAKELDAYYAYDPAKAKALLAQAGFGGGFTLHLPLIPQIVNDAMSSAIQHDFGAIGVAVVWDQVDASILQKIFVNKAYSGMVMNLGQSSNDWMVIRTVVLPGTFNMFGTTDPTVQALTAKIQTEPADAAKADLKALNAHLVQDGWFIPFYRMTYSLVTGKNVKATTQSGMAVPSIYDYTPAK